MIIRSLLIAALLLGGTPTANALGTVDGELGVVWWANDFDASFAEGVEAGALGAYGELWVGDKWGGRAAYYRSDLDDVGLDSAYHYSIDIKRRFLSATDNTYGAIGLGWENINPGEGGSTSGLRLVGEGRVGLGGVVYLYGIAAWMPYLGDNGTRTEIKGSELEFGAVFDPLPFLSLRAGYRRFKISFDGPLNRESAETKGFLVGAGVHW